MYRRNFQELEWLWTFKICLDANSDTSKNWLLPSSVQFLYYIWIILKKKTENRLFNDTDGKKKKIYIFKWIPLIQLLGIYFKLNFISFSRLAAEEYLWRVSLFLISRRKALALEPKRAMIRLPSLQSNQKSQV